MLPAVRAARAASRLSRGAAGGPAAAGAWQKPQLGMEMPQPGDGRLRTITVLPGDGVGPEVIKAAQAAIAATGARARALARKALS
jgi:hypothetical protein